MIHLELVLVGFKSCVGRVSADVSAMATDGPNQELVLDHLRKQLAVTARSIQWSYAIFWSLSNKQQGVLEWCDGYYNGVIKTRKTAQEVELKDDMIVMQRSEQLRGLYISLLEGETETSKRPSASLSPEDLSDAEWYYLVCMSFVFNPGQCLPGRSFSNGETIWLCNAQYADSKVFVRSLLARSASVQTVVCFPYLGGVVEIGVTELVKEDPGLLQHMKACLLDCSKPSCLEKFPALNNTNDDKESMCAKLGPEIAEMLDLDNICSPPEQALRDLRVNIPEHFGLGSSDDCSFGCDHNQSKEDSFMLASVNGSASQVQSWQLMDDEPAINFGDCLSEAITNQPKEGVLTPKFGSLSQWQSEEPQQGNRPKLGHMKNAAENQDVHYKRTISLILQCSAQLLEVARPCFKICGYKSSFRNWKDEGLMAKVQRPRTQQSMLKKILFTVPWMHDGKVGRNFKTKKSENNDITEANVLMDKIRENEKYLILRSLVPSINRVDKTSLLNDTIEYLRELEARVEELESCMESVDFETRPKRKQQDMVEQTSDNYELSRKIENGKKQLMNKRKASDIEELLETEVDLSRLISNDNSSSLAKLRVSMGDQEVVIEMRCPYREYILLDVMDAINTLHLDAHSVQSCTTDGFLNLTLKSKFRGAAVAPAGMIKQALWKVAGKC